MRHLKLRGSSGIPFISLDFDSGIIHFSGEAYSEHNERHFLPTIAALQSQVFKTKTLEIHFYLTKIGASGNRELIRFLKLIKQRQTEGLNVNCYWYQESGTYVETGDHLGELLGLPFHNLDLPLIPDLAFGY